MGRYVKRNNKYNKPLFDLNDRKMVRRLIAALFIVFLLLLHVMGVIDLSPLWDLVVAVWNWLKGFIPATTEVPADPVVNLIGFVL